jgi:hypothetical protein
MRPLPGSRDRSPAPGAPGEGPLVPLLRPGDDPADPLTLVTWYQALSSALATDVPHDLLGFWLYPASGGSILLGPAELAADRLAGKQIYHASECLAAVERRRGATDDLDPAEIERRNLDQTQVARLGSVDRKSIGENLGVAAP